MIIKIFLKYRRVTRRRHQPAKENAQFSKCELNVESCALKAFRIHEVIWSNVYTLSSMIVVFFSNNALQNISILP